MVDLSRYQPATEVRIKHPEWSKSAAIYQINTRQFTPEGTFRAASTHLPRLKDLGVDILWLMPVHPIGEQNRKGSLGSPYAVRDYYAVNPELGTLDAAIVLSVVSEGMPLIYNGQEAGNDRRLAFFEKDPIQWRQHPQGELYRRLLALKKANTALWNAAWGARMVHVPNSAQSQVFSFVRGNERDKVFAVFNFSSQPITVRFEDGLYHGDYTDYFRQEQVQLDAATVLPMAPWSYRVFVQ